MSYKPYRVCDDRGRELRNDFVLKSEAVDWARREAEAMHHNARGEPQTLFIRRDDELFATIKTRVVAEVEYHQ